MTALFALMTCVNAFALNDAVTVREVSALKADLAAEANRDARLERLELFKDFLFNRLQTMPLPQNEAEKDAFAELNEFEADVFMINMRSVSKTSCERAWRKITSANAVTDETVAASGLPSAARETLDILKALCR